MSDRRLDSLRQTLESAFQPTRLQIIDESWKHAGHAGASDGGGHFAVEITATAFEGKNRLERQRMVYESLKEDFGFVIHALSVRANTPDEK